MRSQFAADLARLIGPSLGASEACTFRCRGQGDGATLHALLSRGQRPAMAGDPVQVAGKTITARCLRSDVRALITAIETAARDPVLGDTLTDADGTEFTVQHSDPDGIGSLVMTLAHSDAASVMRPGTGGLP